MNTNNQITSKKQAIYVLRALTVKMNINGKYALSNQQLKALENQLITEMDSMKPQSLDVDWIVQLLQQLNTIIQACDIQDDIILKRIESCAIFAYQFSRCTNMVDCTVALSALLGSLYSGSITKIMTDKISFMFNKCFIGEEALTIYEPQSLDELFDSFRESLDFTTSLVELPLMKKMHRFLLYALSHSLLDKMGIDFDTIGYGKFEAEAIRRAHKSKVGLWHSLLDAMCMFCQQFFKCVKSGSYEPFLHSTTSYDCWVTLVYKLKRQERFLSNPAPHDFDIFTFRSELDDAIAQGKSIVKFASVATKVEKDKLRMLLADLELIKSNDITKKSTQRDRAAPFAILLAGGSSVGKSHLTNIMFQYFAELKNLPSGSEFKYTRNFTEEFWNGFTSSQWFIILDDIASLSPSLGTLDPSLAEVINVVNNVAFVPNQAELADKGKTPCLAQLVIATTNTPDLNAYAYFSCPLAIQRRIPWVVNVMPREEFARNSVMLDPSKCVGTEGRFDDFWSIKVEKIVPASDTLRNQRAKLEEVVNFDNIDDFLGWFGTTAMQHSEQQDSLAKAEHDMKKISVCRNKGCYMPLYACKCLESQSLTEINSSMVVSTTNMTFISETGNHYFRYASYFSCILFAYLYGYMQKFLFYIFSLIMPKFDLSRWEEYCTRKLILCLAHRVELRVAPFKIYAKIFMIGAATLGVVTTMVYLYPKKQKCMEKQSKVDSIGKRPTSNTVERENVWYKEDFNVSSFDLTTTSKSWKSLDNQKIRDILFKNIFRFRFEMDVGHWKNTGAFALGGSLYAVNLHAVPKRDIFKLQIISSKNESINTNLEITVTKNQLQIFPDNDIAILNLSNMPPRKDVSGLLVTSTLNGKYVGEYMGLSVDLEPYINPVKDLIRINHKYANKEQYCWRGLSQKLTAVGDCGSVLITFTPLGPVILGLHSMGNHMQEIIATPITQNMVDIAKTFFKSVCIQNGTLDLTLPQNDKYTLGPLHSKSPFRFIPNGVASVYGSFVGHKSVMQSRVERTCIADVAEKYGYVQKFGKPLMKGWLPWRIAISDMVNIPTSFRKDILSECVRSFTNDILTRLTHNDLKQVEVYDKFTSINGAAGVAYVDKINRNTSMGFPWCKSKKHYIHFIPPQGDLLDPVDFDECTNNRVQKCIETYLDGYRYMPVFTAHLKDEPTKYSKIDAGKTRVFGGAPVDWSIVVRMYLLSSIRLIQNNRFIFESAPGTIAQSKEWGDIYRYLVHFGEDQIVAGDYKAFDKSMPPDFILSAYEILINICKDAGYTDDDIRILTGISLDTAYPLFNMNGDLVEFFGSNPSGHPLTVIINGLANALYMRYCYFVLNPNKECHTFKDNVHLMTYGDDNVMGVSKCCSWFNHTAIQSVLAVYGVTYTMADKEALSVPYINIKDVSFLKRSWLWCEELGDYLCPLEHESIEKSIMTCVVSKSVSAQYQAIAIVSTACQEYFFYGKIEFEKRRSVLMKIVQESGLDDFVEANTFPTWELLCERFHTSARFSAHNENDGFTEVSQSKYPSLKLGLKTFADYLGLLPNNLKL